MKVQKVSVLVLLLIAILFVVGCDKSQQLADKYSKQLADKIITIKAQKEFYQPTKDFALEFLKTNEDGTPIEQINIVQIGEGTISISVNGKVGSATYQTPAEYQLEKEKISIGPVIKKFCLGMSSENVMSVIKETFPQNEINNYVKTEDLIYFSSGRGDFLGQMVDMISKFVHEKSYFIFKDDKLTEMCINASDINHLFNSGDMSLEKFAQNFIDSYSFITELKPYKKEETDTDGVTKCMFIGYNYESDYGWELKILDTPVYYTESSIYGASKNIAGSIVLTKKQTSAELKFGD